MPFYNQNTTADIVAADVAAQIEGKVILTTGVSSGTLGATFVESIAQHRPALLILAGRSLTKIQETGKAITAAFPAVTVRLLELDLSSLAAVRKAAEKVNAWDDIPHIDVLVNNAGVMGVPWSKTVDGIESTFEINHLAHFLFTNLIITKLLAAKNPRVVNVGSEGHRFNPVRFGDYNFHGGSAYNKWQAYGQSKTANMLFSVSLAKKLGGRLKSYCLHPGFSGTHLADHIDWQQEQVAIQEVEQVLGNETGPIEFRSPAHCAATHVYAAFDPALEAHNGGYLLNCHVADPFVDTVKPWGTSEVEAEKLWRLSEKLVEQKFTY
ncbi:short-chain dehydrogenase [Podospora australis]|uniref:Short-chain dehydrogenase n=1 Tax=Podospora australis TaxID=1536484 RepID=A0AAN7AEY7_9PEZI|nr:short-chain dehydrogenase [Podospora australis]